MTATSFCGNLSFLVFPDTKILSRLEWLSTSDLCFKVCNSRPFPNMTFYWL